MPDEKAGKKKEKIKSRSLRISKISIGGLEVTQKQKFKQAAKRCKGKPGFRACMSKALRKK